MSESEEWVHAVYVIGLIFFATPIIISAIGIFSAFLTSTSFDMDAGQLALTSIQVSSFIAMVYPRIRSWHKRRYEKKAI